MTNADLMLYGKVGGLTVLCLLIYSFLWRKNFVLALILLAGILGYLAHSLIDWNYWRQYTVITAP